MKMRSVIGALLVALLGLSAVSGATMASAETVKVPHITAHAFPSGTEVYYTYDKGYGAVIATSGVNVSKTASFTISAQPYNGAVFAPADGTSAFAGYLGQLGEWVYGPGTAYVPPGYLNAAPPPGTAGLKLLATVDNAYTNHVRTYVYEGTGLDAHSAVLAQSLLEKGWFS